MKYTLLFLIFISGSFIFAQSERPAAVSLPVTLKDNGPAHAENSIYFGIDPEASDGIDTILYDESDLPPYPPAGSFDFRFLLPAGNLSSLFDYRYGELPFSGTIEYQLHVLIAGDTATLKWDFPENVTGTLMDPFGGILINKEMSGKDSLKNGNLAINTYKMIINFNNVGGNDSTVISPDSIKTPDFCNMFGIIYPGLNRTDTLYFGYDSTATSGIDSAFGEGNYFSETDSSINSWFILPDDSNTISIRDIRKEEFPFKGTLEFLVSLKQDSARKIFWNFPEDMKGEIIDHKTGGTLFSELMTGNDTLTIKGSELTEFKLYVEYGVEDDTVSVIRQGNLNVNSFKLFQNYPNPFNPATTISFEIPKDSKIRLVVYDILGNKIKTLVDQRLEKGLYQTKFSAGSMASGIYFYRLTAGDLSITKKMLLIK